MNTSVYRRKRENVHVGSLPPAVLSSDKDSVKGARPVFRNAQPFLDCLLLMLCHRPGHTHIASHSAPTLSVAPLRSRGTVGTNANPDPFGMLQLEYRIS